MISKEIKVVDIREELLKEHSKSNANKIARYISDDARRFGLLMVLFLSNEYRVTQRAAQVVSICTDNYPDLISPYLKQLILNLRNDIHDAVKRNSLRILQNIELPDSLHGEMADIGFSILASGEEPVAIKVFAMTVLANLCKREPDLKNELQIIIEDQMPYGSAGFISRGSKILKRLQHY
ncbi:hypothetical protein LVD17_03860 [Fulvivirga ulvae]|uniref:hypothetical protein n=1 Tax=Fulvivirga ulvae TaxID=2904245 RepID=UPI001F1D16E4|nr:hypothetical protein [Fulvivirga ulvae]UII32962.1 hypothetical protein LVD17_03860 [Fulvivirga ulvae]